MSSPNIFVSNGTCYTAAGEKLDASFIPCGNDAYGHQTCCGAGDNCLADNACFGIHGFGYGSYLTYMAGCTDPDYQDTSCPDKEGIDQPWIALTLCDHSDGAWAACSQKGDPSTLQAGSYCSCTDAASSTIAFRDSNSLANEASLPQRTGESIQFYVGYVPTAPPPAASTKTLQPSTSSTGGDNTETTSTTSSTRSGLGSSVSQGVAPSQTQTSPGGAKTQTSGTTSSSVRGSSSSSSDTNSGLSSGTKVAIGVGTAAGVLALLALVALAFVYRRRRRRASGPRTEGSLDDSKKPIPSPTKLEADGQPVAEAAGQPARPWSMRSELEGDNQPLANNLAEMAGRDVAPRNPGPTRPLPRSLVPGGAQAPLRAERDGEIVSPVAELQGDERW